MKHRLIILTLLLSCFLFSCKKEDNLTYIDYKGDYYITSSNNTFVFEFAYNKKIEKINIENIKTSNNSKIEYTTSIEKNEDGSYFMINKNYIGAFTFILPYDEFKLESFELLLNDNFKEIININLDIKTLEKSDNLGILPISTPFVGGFCEDSKWVLLARKKITIIDINFYESLNTLKTIYVNSLLFNNEVVVNENEKVYIDVFYDYTKKSNENHFYLEIIYKDEFDNINKYISDKVIFGNSLDIIGDNL